MIETGILGLISMGGGFVGGLIKKLIDNNQDFKMAAVRAEQEERKQIRGIKDEFFKWTRRTIALSFVAYVLGGMMYAAITGLPIYVAYYEANSTIMTIFRGDADVIWKALPPGFVLPLSVTNGLYAILGFYFGSGGPRR